MHQLIEELLSGGPVVTDGAWGTQLHTLGLATGECPDHWNLLHADRVEQVPRAYVEAGSRVVLTNTFQANRLVLAGHDLAEKTVDINRAGAEISRRAADGRAKVFASMGPSGKMLFAGETTEDELTDVFTQQAQALADGGADAIVLETMGELAEAKVALAAARTTGLPVVACMCFDSGKDNTRTLMGVTPEQAAAGLAEAGADVIGANCGQGIEGYIAICRLLRAATELPVWIKANAGLPEMEGETVVYRTGPEDFARHGPALVEAGANFLGGCCGTGPEFIAALQQAIGS